MENLSRRLEVKRIDEFKVLDAQNFSKSSTRLSSFFSAHDLKHYPGCSPKCFRLRLCNDMATATTGPDLSADMTAPPSPSAEVPRCAICLEPSSGLAVLHPCKHDCFDYECLITWLVTNNTCPLCKQTVNQIQHDFDPSGKYLLSDVLTTPTPTDRYLFVPPTLLQSPDLPWYPPPRGPTELEELVPGLQHRCHVYRNQLYSLHVGSNPVSGYTEITHNTIRADERLVRKAKKWIRRELQVFRFTDPEWGPGSPRRRASHTEHLIQSIAILIWCFDFKDESAEHFLAEDLGRDYARLFLHELAGWMRSPCRTLAEYDQLVQYENR